jgi:hypothetical protein
MVISPLRSENNCHQPNNCHPPNTPTAGHQAKIDNIYNKIYLYCSTANKGIKTTTNQREQNSTL